MTNDFEALSRLQPRAPSSEARHRALNAAMQAFEDAEKKSVLAQGNVRTQRPSSIINTIWSAFMNKKLLSGSALAALLVLPAAGYLSVQFFHQQNAKTAVSLEQAKVSEKSAYKDEIVAGKKMSSAVEPAGVQRQEIQKAESPSPKNEVAPRDLAESGPQLDDQLLSKPSLKGEIAPAPYEDKLYIPESNRERYAHADTNPVKSVISEPVSTFSADVDTASYAFVRKALMNGQRPDPDAVRVEEMINYFPYQWPGPDSADQPFKATVTVTPTPWNAHTQLMHIGIKGYDVIPTQAPRANLVFLIDVSGSMEEPDKLPLLKNAFRLLIDKLKPEDTVSIVVYAGSAGTVLEPTSLKNKAKILDAINNLEAGGSTAGAQGIEAAYALAQQSFIENGINRVMLATDGDFNVGDSSDEDLKKLIEKKRKSGIFLSVLGFGRGNLNDSLMQTLAQNGNGTAAYIDTLLEAQKALVEEAGSSLFPIAKDVKFQVEFNPAKVAEYRLIGYETRALNREDFNNDRVDAGDIGSGHRVTAIYEITPKGSPAIMTDDLRYDPAKPAAAPESHGDEMAFLKIRAKKPGSDTSELTTIPVTPMNAVSSLEQASDDVRFSIAVAAFGQKLRNTTELDAYSYDEIKKLAMKAQGSDAFGYRGEFLRLIDLAKNLPAQ